MSNGRWGYVLSGGVMCVRCKVTSTHNPPCLSCSHVLCEPCFQFGNGCCDNMIPADGKLPTLRNRQTQTQAIQVENPHLFTLLCTDRDCLVRTTIGRYQRYKIVEKDYGYCPMCGASAKIIEYNTDSYWNILGKRYGMRGDLVKQLYGVWDTKEFPRFADFINDFKAEAAVK